MPDGDGYSYRTRLLKAYPDPDDPIAPPTVRELSQPPPCGMGLVWGYWLDLSRTRGAGMAAPEPLTHLEMQAWSVLRPDIYLNSQIVSMIFRVDGVFRRAWSERNSNSEDDEND